ncbi:hypothetical protein CDD82_761 [Ophiocordyceps australis]|uniref:Transcription initiation factor TFIID subunit 9 n=1 Tax=Ophiocordyceps australis TaxID=1399860 RepID=A0A2C5ZN32_9HYPO|nr:hypothetical protein CDD82_761 [Ophiocordyceps australis]
MASSQAQVNGVNTSFATTNGSQTAPNTQNSATSQPAPCNDSSNPTQQPSQPSQSQLQSQAQVQTQAQASSSSDPRPRDARLIELLLSSQGVTAYEQRVPLLLLDFGYRHASSVLSDAMHLASDPYISQAGSRPSASAGATAVAPGEAPITANAIKVAVASRLSYQFRGGSSGGGISKDYMQELARERNKISLPRINPSEWGIRLPSERFVVSGTTWGLKDLWEGDTDEDADHQDNAQDGDAMDGIQGPDLEDIGGDGVEGGTMEDVFGDDVDEEMAEDG